MIIGNKNFIRGKTYVMGILNVTPDSFSDGGMYAAPDLALRHAEEMIRDGADIIDIGGESTRPGHTQISADEESERIVHIVEAIKRRFDVPVSVDTYKASVAESALDAGADLINDIWGFKYDNQMAELVSKRGAACCLMHNKNCTIYSNFIKDAVSELAECVNIAKSAGISDDKIILDPGIGFGKTYEQNLEVMRCLDAFDIGYPLLLGTSRKSMIGKALGLDTDERLEGTLVTTVIAVQHGYMFVRVHDVKENKRAITMAEAIFGETSK